MSHYKKLVHINVLLLLLIGFSSANVLAYASSGNISNSATTSTSTTLNCPTTLPTNKIPKGNDLSGLALLSDKNFLVVHDIKYDKTNRSRVSILLRPDDNNKTLRWKTINLQWPQPFCSNDLESISAIPGTDQFLLFESGNDNKDDSTLKPRMFLVEYTTDTNENPNLKYIKQAPWPTTITNVEATAVAKLNNGKYVFAYAERAEGSPITFISWATFQRDTLKFDKFQTVTFNKPSTKANRAIVGMDFDSSGALYTIAAFDPDEDTGPFTSTVWKIGQLNFDSAVISLDNSPTLLGTVDGLKVESIVVDGVGVDQQIYIGTDDEDLGGVLRPLPPLPQKK